MAYLETGARVLGIELYLEARSELLKMFDSYSESAGCEKITL